MIKLKMSSGETLYTHYTHIHAIVEDPGGRDRSGLMNPATCWIHLINGSRFQVTEDVDTILKMCNNME